MKVKVLWLCHYPVNILDGYIELMRTVKVHPASWIINLANEIKKNTNIELHILTFSPYVKSYQSCINQGIHFHVLRTGIPFIYKGFPSFFPFNHLTKYWFLSQRTNKIIKKIKPDIIHAHGTEGPYGYISTKFNTPTIISIQGIVNEIVKFEPTFVGTLQKSMEIKLIKAGTHFGCRTNFDTAFVKKNNSSAIIHYLPEAINSVYFKKEWKGIDSDEIVYVGTLNERKGVLNLILAVIKILETKDIKLHLIGKGSNEFVTSIKNIIQIKKAEKHFIFHDFLNSNEIANILSTSAIFVLPTLVDNSPNSLLEAMAVGVPSIATDVGGISSMILNGVDGLLIKPQSINEITNSVIILLNNRNLRIEMSENSRKKALSNNYPKIVGEIYYMTYLNLIHGKA